jgi:hypothetical protein
MSPGSSSVPSGILVGVILAKGALAVEARVKVTPNVLGSTSMASSVRVAAQGAVVTGTGLTGGSWVGSRITTLGEGHGDNTGGPGETCVAVKPPGIGTGRLGELSNTPRGNARRVGGGSVYRPGAEATALPGNFDLPLLIVGEIVKAKVAAS